MWVVIMPSLQEVSGGTIENHSLNHGHMTEMTDDEVVNEIHG